MPTVMFLPYPAPTDSTPRVGLWRGKVYAGLAAILFAVALAIVEAPTPAQAYCTFGKTWSSTASAKQLTMFSSNVPSSRRTRINDANRQFHLTSGSKLKVKNATYTSNLSSWDAAKFKLTFGSPGNVYLPDSSPGVTWRGSWGLPLPKGGNKATVFLNPKWTWSTKFKKSAKKADLKTVVLHELGHAHGLAHPWDNYFCSDGGSMSSAEKAAVMNATFTNKRTLKSDDIKGLAKLY